MLFLKVSRFVIRDGDVNKYILHNNTKVFKYRIQLFVLRDSTSIVIIFLASVLLPVLVMARSLMLLDLNLPSSSKIAEFMEEFKPLFDPKSEVLCSLPGEFERSLRSLKVLSLLSTILAPGFGLSTKASSNL